MIPHKAFVVADIPAPHRDEIQVIRERLKTITSRLPVEITLAGSSGVGPIPEGTDLELIRSEVERIAGFTTAFKMEFGEIGHFPDTGVFFIAPKNRRPFDLLHASLASSKIPFARSQFPYNPHCTLRIGPEVEQSIRERIYSIPVPRGEMMLDSISVFAIHSPTLVVSLLHRAKLAR